MLSKGSVHSMLPGLIHSQKWHEARIETIFRYMQYIVAFVAFFMKFSACFIKWERKSKISTGVFFPQDFNDKKIEAHL